MLLCLAASLELVACSFVFSCCVRFGTRLPVTTLWQPLGPEEFPGPGGCPSLRERSSVGSWLLVFVTFVVLVFVLVFVFVFFAVLVVHTNGFVRSTG